MASQTIEIGQIYRIKADESNDITPKAGLLFRAKYFVVMGFDIQGNIYGGVVFDSVINRNFVSHDFEDFFLPIPCSKYSFLDHDSFIDCRKMKPSSLEKLLEGEFCGDIAQDDYQNVVKLLKMSPRETYVHLKAFGLI
jgi:hypothetical protein